LRIGQRFARKKVVTSPETVRTHQREKASRLMGGGPTEIKKGTVGRTSGSSRGGGEVGLSAKRSGNNPIERATETEEREAANSVQEARLCDLPKDEACNGTKKE